jgi:hypothetical protein
VARKVEDSIATLSGIKHIRTSITGGLVQISAEFVLEKKLADDAIVEIENIARHVRMGKSVRQALRQVALAALNRYSRQFLITFKVQTRGNGFQFCLSDLNAEIVTNDLAKFRRRFNDACH